MKVTHISICVLFVLMCGTCDAALTATLSSGPHAITGVVKYTQLLCNTDGQYNPSTGKFTAPETGTYLVSVTMMTGTVAGHVTLRKNGPRYVWLYTGNAYDMATQTVCMELQMNEQIWVEREPSTMILFDVYNTFTVVKVLG